LYYYWDFESVEKEFKIIKQLGPSSDFPYDLFADYLLSSGEFGEALNLTKNILILIKIQRVIGFRWL
jgi:hypothetical protein